jgi:hypothetical protein
MKYEYGLMCRPERESWVSDVHSRAVESANAAFPGDDDPCKWCDVMDKELATSFWAASLTAGEIAEALLIVDDSFESSSHEEDMEMYEWWDKAMFIADSLRADEHDFLVEHGNRYTAFGDADTIQKNAISWGIPAYFADRIAAGAVAAQIAIDAHAFEVKAVGHTDRFFGTEDTSLGAPDRFDSIRATP